MAMACHDNWQSGKTLSQSASFMLENEIATDVIFKFPNSDETIKAHRLILMARSHVFYVMFNSSLDKPGEAIAIFDIERSIFKEFLKYLYTDETTLSAETALHLTYCAEKYEVTDLKAKCTDFLKSQVDETTVAVILDHAVMYNDDVLVSTCRDTIETLETLNCLEEHHVTKDTMELVLGFEGLVVKEVDTFKFCNTWAENECKRIEVPVNGSNKREILGPLLRKIPFCSMTHDQFATEVSGKHLLNGQEELQIFRFIGAHDKSNPPFPCKSKTAINKMSIAVKLPEDLCRTSQDSPFRLNVSCSKPYTLLGLGFRQSGNYDISFNGILDQSFCVEEKDLCGVLETPVKYCARGYLVIRSLARLHSGMAQQEHSFTHVKRLKGRARPIQLDFRIFTWGQPPFDTLILKMKKEDMSD